MFYCISIDNPLKIALRVIGLAEYVYDIDWYHSYLKNKRYTPLETLYRSCSYYKKSIVAQNLY